MSKGQKTTVFPEEIYQAVTSQDVDWVLRLMEQYTQAKVLEALEREFSKVDISMFDEDRGSDYIEQGKFYYETEVKPKYE